MQITVPSQRLILYIIVVVSVLLSASGSFLTVANGRNDSDRLACNTLYNQLNGLARDERAAVAAKATRVDKKQVKAERDVWIKILKQTTEPQSGSDEEQLKRFVETINLQIKSLDDKLIALKKIQHSRIESPYPDPDACKDGEITREEGNTL